MLIGVDLMGGDSSPEVLYQGVLLASKKWQSSCRFLVFATFEIIEQCQSLFDVPSNIEFFPVNTFIETQEAPLLAIRKKRQASMIVALKMLKEKKISAFVSAGNTGALIASSKIFLQKLPSIDRPSLLTVLPTELGSVAIVDVGGNVNIQPKHLVQFAKIGSAYLHSIHHIENPRIGLLNIGQEAIKGSLMVRKAYEELKEHCSNFVGNIEGRDVFQGKVDVLVTDGFTGNVFLKTAEGISSFILNYLQKEISSDYPKALQNIRRVIEYDEYLGAIVCGVEGVVVKCHGYSTSKAMKNGISGAISLVKNQLIARLKDYLS